MDTLIAVPAGCLAVVVNMSSQHIEDIESGLEEHMYKQEDNQDLPEKKRALSTLEKALFDAENGPLWTMQVPVLSTGHVTEATMSKLDAGDFPWLASAKYHEGLFMRVDTSSERFGELPAELQGLLTWAKTEHYDWLRLDADGCLIEALPEFDW